MFVREEEDRLGAPVTDPGERIAEEERGLGVDEHHVLEAASDSAQ